MLKTSSPVVVSAILLLSLPFLFVLAPRLLAPKTLPAISLSDELDDLALFRRATLSADHRSRSSPRHLRLSGTSTSPPKVAFLFLTNSDLHFAPLWERFFRGHRRLYNVYVHADPTSPFSLPADKHSVFRGRVIPSKTTQRASPTLISAARRLLAAALLDDPSNAFFALISQHCVPLHSFRFVYGALFSDSDRDGGGAGTNPANTSSSGPSRLRHGGHRSFIEIIADDEGLWKRYVARGDDAMLPEVPFDSFRVGSQFFVLTRRHAALVVRDRVLWRKFRLPCLRSRKDSCYPEEHYFPTLLSMRDPAACTGYTLTRVNWTDSVGGHPHTYHPGEVTAELVAELRRSNHTGDYLFARKFSPECLEPLMGMVDSVIFKD